MNWEYFNYIKLVELVTSIYEAATAYIAKKCMRDEMKMKRKKHSPSPL